MHRMSRLAFPALRTLGSRQMSQQASRLKEYSVIYTDRAKNLMCSDFSQAMKDISSELNSVYNADKCVMIPGSGTYAMEAVAGQFALRKTDPNYKPSMVIRNGYFSFRWSDIWSWVFPQECTASPELVVVKANPTSTDTNKPSFVPPSLDSVVSKIREEQPCVLFAPHVETSAGILLSDEYIRAVADAVHEANPNAVFVLDGIASGNKWVDMKALGVDVYITAPQKGWTGPACVGIAMMSERAMDIMAAQNSIKPQGHSFCCNLAKWNAVADAYAAPGGFMYHTTLPTDSLMVFRDVIMETKQFGYDQCSDRMMELGTQIRDLLGDRGFQSVAAPEVAAPTVVVAYQRDEADSDIAARFKAQGIQVAAGVPLNIGEPWESFGAPPTFRLGLFGLDKLGDVDGTVQTFKDALDQVS